MSKKTKKQNDDQFWNFPNQHPGWEYQTIQRRKENIIPGIINWHFVDTSKLNGNILSEETVIGEIEEEYAKTVLILCYAYRSKADLLKNDSFVLKYREVYRTHIEPNRHILQTYKIFIMLQENQM